MHREIIGSYLPQKKNFVFVGEAGSGKSELSLNFARQLVKLTDKPVHFFDLDMTKPLFRSRDAAAALEESGVIVHFMEQFMDAPTLVGGVDPLLRDENAIVVMDVGGDHIGARSIGGFAPRLNRPDAAVFYLINPYRPWSDTIDHIDETLGKILGVSHIQLTQLTLVSNPNNGSADTSVQEIIDGHRETVRMVGEYIPVSFCCARDELAEEVAKAVEVPVFPLRLELLYPWLV